MRKKIWPILLGLIVLAWLGFIACSQEDKGASRETDAMKAAQVKPVVAWNKICPVCGGEVSSEFRTVKHDGKVFGFGCAGCPEKFAANPEIYANKLSADGTKLVEGG